MSVIGPIVTQIIEENHDGILEDDLINEMLRRLTPEQRKELIVEIEPGVDRILREWAESN